MGRCPAHRAVAARHRAAIYRLLAEQPGLSVAPGITDPLGRVGVAIGDGGGGGGDYLIIQPGTAELLAYTSHPVRADSVMPASDGVEVYQRFGWSNQLGVRPEPSASPARRAACCAA